MVIKLIYIGKVRELLQADPSSVDVGKLSPYRVRKHGRSMSVQSSLDPYGSNTTLSSCGSDQEQEQDSGVKIEPQINLINDSIQDNYQDLMTSTMILTRQENFIEDDGNLDRTTGLYIRLVIKQDGRPDLVWLYKTHKF
ncbi:Protein of unknown function [Cotesia congregata]|uniref:Uncharacterized protein n=1 Tax=Cotesia congregata TaxID=51543 RepID=A0A8J2EIS4_COTCN|nr:Protein of unknown function [Cotesia congregata]